MGLGEILGSNPNMDKKKKKGKKMLTYKHGSSPNVVKKRKEYLPIKKKWLVHDNCGLLHPGFDRSS